MGETRWQFNQESQSFWGIYDQGQECGSRAQPLYAIIQGQPPHVTPRPGPQGLVSQRIREGVRRGSTGGTEDWSRRRRTGGQHRRRRTSGRAGVRGSVTCRRRAGPTWSGARAGQCTSSHQPARSLGTRRRMEEWSRTIRAATSLPRGGDFSPWELSGR